MSEIIIKEINTGRQSKLTLENQDGLFGISVFDFKAAIATQEAIPIEAIRLVQPDVM